MNTAHGKNLGKPRLVSVYNTAAGNLYLPYPAEGVLRVCRIYIPPEKLRGVGVVTVSVIARVYIPF